MQNKQIKIIALIIGGLVVISLLYFSIGNKPKLDQNQDQVSQEENINTVIDVGSGNSGIKTTVSGGKFIIEASLGDSEAGNGDDRDLIDIKRISLSFVERFGSYSNQSNYDNIRDLEIFMTDKMKKWAEGYISDAIKKRMVGEAYYGITTKSISSEPRSFNQDEGRAEIVVKTQRRELNGDDSDYLSFYQDIVLYFIKEGDSWKVDGAYWQSR